MIVIVIVVIVVIVTGGKQSQLLAFALGLGWSLTIKCPGISDILTYFTGHRVLFNKSYKEMFLYQSL